jgi:Cu+-exporting ATPase
MMKTHNIIKPILYGIIASLLLLGIYFTVLILLSGWGFTQDQFSQFWYFIVSLALGFGIQVGLFTYLKDAVKNSNMAMEGKTVAVTGTTSTLSMISCCAHYLVNIVPILGIAGAISIIAQYQTEIFWVGLAFNIFGIAFISNKIIKFKKYHE